MQIEKYGEFNIYLNEILKYIINGLIMAFITLLMLTRNGRRPRVVFSPLLPKDQVQTLKAIVQRHHGMVEKRADQATHEIIPDASTAHILKSTR
jgi:hypothetical protein